MLAGLLLLALAGPWPCAPCPGDPVVHDPAPEAGTGGGALSAPAALPPAPPWDGATRALMAAADDPWITPAERTGLAATPRYAETVDWLARLVEAAPQLRLVELGRSLEDRAIWMVVASREGAATPSELAANGRPTVLAQAGIHAGEIDGKDAGLMLLRDMTVGGRERGLLDGANFLFVPILSVDGHERFSVFSRINQRGPLEMGWRTNARNQNLNRDYAKLDTPELRAVVAAIGAWRPDLYLDLHVTDGIDYQYDVTFGFNGPHGHSPAIAAWLQQRLRPRLTADLKGAGHVPGPLIFAVDDRDLSQGVVDWTAPPRFSNGWGDARHLPTVLVENHSLKPYDQRVLGTYVLLRGVLRLLASEGEALRAAVAADRARRPAEVVLSWLPSQVASEPAPFLGVKHAVDTSPVSGGRRVRWLGVPETVELRRVRINRRGDTAALPAAYWIPAAWPEVAERLALQGVRLERIDAPRTVEVDMDRIAEFDLGQPFEGHVTVTPRRVERERRRETWPAGSWRVTTDQPLGELAALLLEPRSGDSFFQWGFFLEVLQRTEYVEAYVMEPLAERMLAADPELAAEFERALAEDEQLAGDPAERLQWLYRRTPWYDDRHLLYPVGREPRRPDALQGAQGGDGSD